MLKMSRSLLVSLVLLTIPALCDASQEAVRDHLDVRQRISGLTRIFMEKCSLEGRQGRRAFPAGPLEGNPLQGFSSKSDPQDRFEAGLYLGYGRSRAEGRSTYHQEWSTLRFARVVENDLLSLDPDPALCASGFLSFYFVRSLGIQAGFGYLKSPLAGSSVFDFSPPAGSASARSDRWEAKGELTAVPLCLNLVGRTGPAAIQAFASGGIALFLNSFFAESFAGLGGTDGGGGEEKIDAFKVPVTVEDRTWTAIGANIGGGFDIKLGKRLALSAEVRYFLCPAKDFAWTWTPGVYEGLGKNIAGLSLSRETAQLAGQRTTPLTIRPSFFQVSAGLKFFLPGIVRISTGSSKRTSS